MTKAIIDEYIQERDFWMAQANQWQYIATLLFVKLAPNDKSFRWPKGKRDIGRQHLEVFEMKAGALKVLLKETPEPEKEAD